MVTFEKVTIKTVDEICSVCEHKNDALAVCDNYSGLICKSCHHFVHSVGHWCGQDL